MPVIHDAANTVPVLTSMPSIWRNSMTIWILCVITLCLSCFLISLVCGLRLLCGHPPRRRDPIRAAYSRVESEKMSEGIEREGVGIGFRDGEGEKPVDGDREKNGDIQERNIYTASIAWNRTASTSASTSISVPTSPTLSTYPQPSSLPYPTLFPFSSSAPPSTLYSNPQTTSSSTAPFISSTFQSDPPPLRRRSYTRNIEGSDGMPAADVQGEILVSPTEGWSRHTRVYGAGVCLACVENERKAAGMGMLVEGMSGGVGGQGDGDGEAGGLEGEGGGMQA